MEARIRKALSSLFDENIAQEARLDNLGGHASLRIYWRIHLPQTDQGWPRDEYTRIAMVLPEDRLAQLKSEEGSSAGAPSSDELPFVDVHRYLSFLKLPVPQIDLVDMDLGILILEDLGDELFEHLYLDIKEDFNASPADMRIPTEQLYHRAINLMVDVQRSFKQDHYDEVTPPETIATKRSFDRELLRWELEHYTEWGLQAQYGEDVLGEHKATLDRIFDHLTEELLEIPQTLVLRDYQSRNIMHKAGKLYLIDFQDALIGPAIYDLVALLRDSYIQLPYVTVHRLVDHYARQGVAAGLSWCDDSAEVQRMFNLQTIQRKLKDAGRFVYIDRVKNNSSFLQYYKPSIAYVRQALEMLDDDIYMELSDILAEFEPAWHHE